MLARLGTDAQTAAKSRGCSVSAFVALSRRLKQPSCTILRKTVSRQGTLSPAM
jgi:hypothetical protein